MMGHLWVGSCSIALLHTVIIQAHCSASRVQISFHADESICIPVLQRSVTPEGADAEGWAC